MNFPNWEAAVEMGKKHFPPLVVDISFQQKFSSRFVALFTKKTPTPTTFCIEDFLFFFAGFYSISKHRWDVFSCGKRIFVELFERLFMLFHSKCFSLFFVFLFAIYMFFNEWIFFHSSLNALLKYTYDDTEFEECWRRENGMKVIGVRRETFSIFPHIIWKWLHGTRL